jgi:hypothetical protein
MCVHDGATKRFERSEECTVPTRLHLLLPSAPLVLPRTVVLDSVTRISEKAVWPLRHREA